MRLLVTGISGFTGSSLAIGLRARSENLQISGIDNLSRIGSETNRLRLQRLGIRFIHGDLRLASDVEALPDCDWVIDAAANPSVLAGVDQRTSSRQLVEHNLFGTANIAEYCKRTKAGLILLSSSRVYSIRALASLPLHVNGDAFALDESRPLPRGVGREGLTEQFSVDPPVSLYGSTKLASELLCLEYGATFGFPVWVNRCGVLSGAGQFGTASQGIFSYWLHAHAARRPLRYIGFDGTGKQVRDALHPEDLAELCWTQIGAAQDVPQRVWNIGGGRENAMSLASLTAWCNQRFGEHAPTPDPSPRPYDVPWLIMDPARARAQFDWRPSRSLLSILDEIAGHAERNPDWLERCGV